MGFSRRTVRRILAGTAVFAVAIVIAAGIGWSMLDADMRRLARHLPTNADVLFWSQDQRDAAFRALDRLPFLAQSRPIANGQSVRPLPPGRPLPADAGVDAHMAAHRIAGLVILQDGRIRLERYGLDFGPTGRWTSFSVAKSLTSTLVGAALQDGAIRSLDDKVSSHVPGLAGSAYDDVTVEQLLTMTSGVRWNEDYEDRESDVARFNRHKADPGVDVTVSYLRRLPREAPPGTRWSYNTGETNLIGVLVSSATGKRLADYLSERIWAPYGMEQPASWILGTTGHEISGCCVQASTRDFARVGQFLLDGGMAGGRPVLPADWIDRATTKRVPIDVPGRGYGYQWWTYDDGTCMARGLFGQSVFIDPARRLVIATNANWPKGTDPAYWSAREQFHRDVQAAIDRERNP